MRTRNELDRLSAAAVAMLAEADSLVDGSEPDRILERILAADRPISQRAQRRRMMLVLAGMAVLVAAAAVASIELAQRSGPAAGDGLRLTGATISLAGYHFRTPAGFEDSSSPCGTSATDRFSAAASADGGCLEAFHMISSSGSAVPSGAMPVAVGAYQGYVVSSDASQRTTLYVVLPAVGGDFNWQAIVLFSQGLTTDQLIAVAQSGLPATPSATIG